MILTTINDNIEVILTTAVTTNQLHIIASYNDTSNISVTPTKTVTVSNNTTAVNLVPSPSSGNQRSLRFASIFNSDSLPSTVTVRVNYNGTVRNVITVTLQVNEYLQYTHRSGWKVFDVNGSLKTYSQSDSLIDSLIPEYFNGGGGSTLLIGTNTFCQYIGKATGSFTQMTLSYNIGSSMVTPSWAELAIYKGNFTLGNNVTVTRCGYTDTSAIWIRTTASVASLISTTDINAGDDLWVVYGNSAATSVGLRSVGIADDIGSGFVQIASGVRPSLNQSISFTLSSTLQGIKIIHSSI